MTDKVDMFHMLSQIDDKNYHWFDSLSDREQKSIAPIVTMRWLSGTLSERQIIFLNEFVNPHIFSLNHHKGLLYRLMCVAVDGNRSRYKWLKTKNKGGTRPISTQVVCDYFRYSSKQAKQCLPLLTAVDVVELAEELGRDKSDISKIKKEMK